MAKRKKKESIAELRKRVSNDEIMDTSAGEMVLDITAKDPDVQSDGLMTTEAKLHPSDCITFYMRVRKDLLDHIKQLARERSYNEQKDITHQMLIIDALEKAYPMEK